MVLLATPKTDIFYASIYIHGNNLILTVVYIVVNIEIDIILIYIVYNNNSCIIVELTYITYTCMYSIL